MSDEHAFQIKKQGERARTIGVPLGFALLVPEDAWFAFRETSQGFEFVWLREPPSEEMPAWLREARGEPAE